MRVALLFAAQVSCAPSEVHVVATGRWVELATDRDDPICAGTIGFLDATVGAGFEVLGETPPDEVFIRYEWLTVSVEASYTRPHGDGILIQTDQLVEEHEIAHAVHQKAWPRSARFMHEGLAILLDAHRIYDMVRWPDDLPLDDILESPLEGGEAYVWAWFIVSQIVHDHGFEGLRELWHAVPPGASAAEVRTSYQAIFGRSIDVLLEPHQGPVQANGFTLALEGSARLPCEFSLCPGLVTIFAEDDDVAIAPGPSGCEDDSDAVGPHSRGATIDGPPVWRETILEIEGGSAQVARPEVLHGRFRPCALGCFGSGGDGRWVSPVTDEDHRGLGGLRWRVEARQELENLPTDDPGAIEIHHSRE